MILIKNFDLIKKKFAGFSKVGIFVTILSLLLSFFFLEILKTPLIPTYIALYLTMISLSFYLNSTYVFKRKFNFKTFLYYYIAYGITMLLGVLLLSIFKKTIPLSNWMLAYLVIPFTMTSNFIMLNIVFKHGRK
ncbi:MAG: hypothetical protein EA412_08650 [Chitinophagaceae bacterium]|nr:MAG: hypothetical protein EA412_08650 [Chitinophagaceae bacterium]